YARGRSIAVSPLNPLPHKTTFHELAHILLGHTAEGDQNDGELTPRSLREAEAECVALLCCAALDLPGIEQARAYVQSWHGVGNPVPEKSAQKILESRGSDPSRRLGCGRSGGVVMSPNEALLREVLDAIANGVQPTAIVSGRIRGGLEAL